MVASARFWATVSPMSFYTQFADSYESIFPFSASIDAFLRRFLPVPGARVLDVGCGTGHYAGALAADGYDVLAVDLDPAMTAYAQAHYPDADFRVLDMRDIGRLEKGYDTVMCIGNTAAHLTQGEFGHFVEAVNGVRRPGASWILQVMNWDYVVTQESVTFPVIEGEGGATFYRTYRDISSARVTFATRLEVGGRVVFEDAVPLYPLLSDEIIRLHHAQGFELIEHVGSYGGAAFDPGSFSANIFVFR